MYTPASFAMSDPSEIHAFLRQNGFALLVTRGGGGLTATHLPLLLDAEAGPRGTLLGHMARANPQWRDVEGEALAVFSGPHAYISPTWYEAPGTVPTWNYAAVHAYGTLRLVEDRDGLHDILTRTTAFYERAMPRPWSYDVDDPDIDKMLRAIVGFRIEIARLEGKAKLNQNHPEERRRKVMQALEARGDHDSRAVAELMRRTLEAGGDGPRGRTP
ncbi:FMN-binding negative transcriptional regulator [Paludisphaera soli]|uniref:FMN-binding negative transcriptional regulator n=1 Tax=Paludisphaera soli TaxID=2712865 RepID=UPI0013ED8589|nr:FMN-binding negative transcriptional regulator [Paludisphaera soli]